MRFYAVMARHPVSKDFLVLTRLQQSKRASTDLHQQLEEITYEASYLRAELQWQKESKKALLHFREEIFGVFHLFEDAFVQVTTRLHDPE